MWRILQNTASVHVEYIDEQPNYSTNIKIKYTKDCKANMKKSSSLSEVIATTKLGGKK